MKEQTSKPFRWKPSCYLKTCPLSRRKHRLSPQCHPRIQHRSPFPHLEQRWKRRDPLLLHHLRRLRKNCRLHLRILKSQSKRKTNPHNLSSWRRRSSSASQRCHFEIEGRRQETSSSGFWYRYFRSWCPCTIWGTHRTLPRRRGSLVNRWSPHHRQHPHQPLRTKPGLLPQQSPQMALRTTRLLHPLRSTKTPIHDPKYATHFLWVCSITLCEDKSFRRNVRVYRDHRW